MLISLTTFKSNRYPLLVTVLFLLASSYVTFFHHHYWFEEEGIYYLHAGEQILSGNGKNVMFPDAPVGGSILLSVLSSSFNNAFFTIKILSLLSVTGVVLLSYYVIKNIFNSKIALLGQLLLVVNPQLDRLSIMSIMDGLPIFLIFFSLYFITKKQLKLSDIVIVGTLLGLSSMIRYQAIPVFLAILIFLLIRDKKIRNNLRHCVFLSIFFVVAFSPIIIYNYSTHGNIIDSNSSSYLILEQKYQTPEWRNEILSSDQLLFSANFHNFNLFIKNYFYNLFYHNPNILFYFDTLGNVSIIPIVPYLGVIPVLGGLVYCLRLGSRKRDLSLSFGIASITAFIVFLFGDIRIHFFAIIIVPLLAVGILNTKNVEKNLLPLLILPVVYFMTVSTIPLYLGYQLFPMWLTIPILSSVFFIEVIPQIYSKIKKITLVKKSESFRRNTKIVTLTLISLVLITNLGFSYKFLDAYLYHDYSYDGIINEFFKIFQKKPSLEESGYEYKKIGDILSKQPSIENSYIMAPVFSYAYYAHSKLVHSDFNEEAKNDTVDSFITRKNWDTWGIYFSNLNSWPIDRYNVFKPVPDYVIFQPPQLPINSTPESQQNLPTTETYHIVKILSDPNNVGIPSNWEVLYKSNKTGVIVYKINHKE